MYDIEISYNPNRCAHLNPKQQNTMKELLLEQTRQYARRSTISILQSIDTEVLDVRCRHQLTREPHPALTYQLQDVLTKAFLWGWKE